MSAELRGRMVAMVAEGKTPLEIRRAIAERWPHFTRGQVNGLLYRLKAEGLRVAADDAGAPRPGKAPLTPEERKARSEFANSFRGLQGPTGGAAQVDQARKRAAPRPAPPKAEPPPAPVFITRTRRLSCSWVDGERGAWVLCEDAAEPGIPFCERHAIRGIQRHPKAHHETVDPIGTQP